MQLGKAIKLCRSQRGLTQGQLATAAGISDAYLSLLERGERSDPGVTTVEAIANALRVPLSILMFLAAEESERDGMDQELADRLSRSVLSLMQESA